MKPEHFGKEVGKLIEAWSERQRAEQLPVP